MAAYTLPARAKDLQGARYGRLIVVSYAGLNNSGKSAWECKCDCGGVKVVMATQLLHGRTRSCGCLLKDSIRIANSKHGMRNSAEYRIWNRMKTRCYNKNHDSYYCYGARGIHVCKEWRESFSIFFQDMGARPSIYHELDRIDVNGDYSKSNCRWVTRKENQRNKRNNRLLSFKGATKTLAEWVEHFHINRNTLDRRLSMGWSAEDSLTKPVRQNARWHNKTIATANNA